MSSILNKHRRQDPPEWLKNLKNIFTSKEGQLTGSRKLSRREIKKAENDPRITSKEDPRKISLDEERGRKNTNIIEYNKK